METARQLKAIGINVFRAGIWKPRTRPGCFEGVGVPGLKWLQRVQNELGMKVCTEVASERHIFECFKHGIDMVWIGARTSANPFLMQEIADALTDTDIPVLVKNPVNPDLSLWMGALERLNNAGVRKLGVIHRGFSSVNEKRLRNSPQWQIAIELRSRIPEMPFFCDPSHMAGCKEYIPELSQRAMNLGLDGLMIESHSNPSSALSDASQQLTPNELINLLESLSIRENDTLDLAYKENMEQLRAQIDEYDSELIRMLAARMEVSRKMGEYKKQNNVAILQTGRWDSIMEKMRNEAALHDLDPEFIATIWSAIHEASVKEQNKILVK